MSLDRVLITGGGGQLASDLVSALSARSQVSAPPHSEMDITDDGAIAQAFAEIEPTVVFNCAAFHNVDACEQQEDDAFAVNVRAVKRLAERCDEHGARLVHLSTNYVFDGARSEPYGEDDAPAPRSVYAISKAAGERAALAYSGRALVVRTAGLYGLRGNLSKGGNFVERMLARAADQEELKMVADQRLSPTYTEDLAAALVEAVEADVEGLLHLTSSGDCSWYDFTVAIMDLAGVAVGIEAVPSAQGGRGVDRPLNGVLARPRADALGLTPLRPWLDGLAAYMERSGHARSAAEGPDVGSPVHGTSEV